MQKPVILMGAGGHAKVLLDVLLVTGHIVLGVIDPKLARQKQEYWRGIPVLGDDPALMSYAPEEVMLANGIGNLPGQTRRKDLYNKYREQGYQFATVAHPSAVLSTGVQLYEGAQIMAGVILQPDVVIGENTLVNTGARIDYDCLIGAHCHLAPGVMFSSGVKVGDGCYAGVGAIVVQGCTMGNGSVLGTGTTLRVNLPAMNRLLGAKPQSISKV